MTAKLFTKVLGAIFLIIGVAGFIKPLAPVNAHGQKLLGIFQINSMQSVIHLASAAAAFAALAGGVYYVKNYLVVFGIVYALVALWGISALTGSANDSVLFGLIHVNLPTELLHIAIAVGTLYFGLSGQKTSSANGKAA